MISIFLFLLLILTNVSAMERAQSPKRDAIIRTAQEWYENGITLFNQAHTIKIKNAERSPEKYQHLYYLAGDCFITAHEESHPEALNKAEETLEEIHEIQALRIKTSVTGLKEPSHRERELSQKIRRYRAQSSFVQPPLQREQSMRNLLESVTPRNPQPKNKLLRFLAYIKNKIRD